MPNWYPAAESVLTGEIPSSLSAFCGSASMLACWEVMNSRALVVALASGGRSAVLQLDLLGFVNVTMGTTPETVSLHSTPPVERTVK